MSDSYMQMELFLQAGLYQNHLIWAANISSGTEPGLPHSDARKWDCALPSISQATYIQSSPPAPEVKCRGQEHKGEAFQKEAGLQERRENGGKGVG